MSFLAFCMLAAVCVAGALVVVLARNPVTSAVALIISLLGVAGLFALAGGGFLAVVQILVYAGAVVTLFIFVVMLLNLGTAEAQERWSPFHVSAGLLLCALMLSTLLSVALAADAPGAALLAGEGTLIQRVSRAVFTRHILAFEVTSSLLLAAVVGVVTLARRERI